MAGMFLTVRALKLPNVTFIRVLTESGKRMIVVCPTEADPQVGDDVLLLTNHHGKMQIGGEIEAINIDLKKRRIIGIAYFLSKHDIYDSAQMWVDVLVTHKMKEMTIGGQPNTTCNVLLRHFKYLIRKKRKPI